MTIPFYFYKANKMLFHCQIWRILNKNKNPLNFVLTDDDTRSFCGQCRLRSDHTEHAVLSLIYNVHIFILENN